MTYLATLWARSTLVDLAPVDFAIIVFYFALVPAIGLYSKERANTGEDFSVAGREMTAWVATLAFLSANLGSLELMGWGQAQARWRIDGSGLRFDHNSTRGAGFGLPSAGFLGVGCRSCVYHPASHFLVGRNNEIRWFLVDMVLHWLVDVGEPSFDHRRGSVGACLSC